MRGQGSLEYLLIAVAVFGLVIGAAFVINAVLESPSTQRDLQLDIIECGNEHLWLKQYFKSYDGNPANAPLSISYYESGLMEKGGSGTPAADSVTACKLQEEWDLNFSRAEGKAWLKTTTGWIEYAMSGGGLAQPLSLAAVEEFIASPDGGAFCPGGGAIIDISQNFVFDIKFDFTGVDKAAITTAELHVWEAFGTADGDVSVSKITAGDFGTNTITGTDEEFMAVGEGSQPMNVVLPFSITEDFVYLRLKKSTASYIVYCGIAATETTHRPYLDLMY